MDSIPFPNQDGIWVPLPESYEYPDLNDDVTDADFIGVLIGDVSGNWKPTQSSAKWSDKDYGSLAITSDPLVAEVVETAANTFEVTFSLTEAVELSAIEIVLTTTSGVTLDTHESLLGSSWVSSISTTDTTITFGATKFPASSIEDVVTFTLTTAGSGESLVSALTILDEDEFEQTLNITLGTSADSDEDGLTDAEEAELGTDPNNADSDGDGLADGVEVELGTSPTTADTDGDGYTDGEEQAEGTSPTDGDDAPSAGMPIWMLYKASQIAAANNTPLDPPSVAKCSEDILGRVDCSDLSTVSLPYRSSGSSSTQRLPKPAYFTFGTFVVSAPSSDYRVAELVAEDRNGRVTPEIDNLSDGQVIGEGQTVQFELRTPPTNGQQSDLRFYLSFEGADGKACNDCTFSLERVFTSN